jgi:hypothetical protein
MHKRSPVGTRTTPHNGVTVPHIADTGCAAAVTFRLPTGVTPAVTTSYGYYMETYNHSPGDNVWAAPDKSGDWWQWAAF